VTGAGGSIGSELCRQISRFGPKELLLLGRGEQSIWEIDRECRNRFPDLDVRPVIADIRDPKQMRSILPSISRVSFFTQRRTSTWT